MAPVAPYSFLLFLVSSSVWLWVALCLPLMIKPVVAADGQGEHCPPMLCGNVNVSFPFELIREGAEPTNCGGGIGFQVRCRNNTTTPYLGSYQSQLSMEILNIFYDNSSLLIIADKPPPPPLPLQHDSNLSSPKGCHIPKDNISSQLVPPLFVSPFNQNLIFYDCTKPLNPDRGLVEVVCHNTTYVRAADGRPDELGSYFLEYGNATIVPVLGVSGKVNATDYVQLLRDGFLATWLLPPPEKTRDESLATI